MLRVLHTADWHLGYVTQQLERDDAIKLAQARLSVVEKIFGVAHRHDVDVMLCAGDLFDTPEPERQWWQELLALFARYTHRRFPIVLLPGNHDPLIAGSVYAQTHAFRRGLPDNVFVVDKRGFELELGTDAVVLASPCTSTAGDTDLALSLPPREPGDTRIRIGLVHGSTFDFPGHETNFPIAKDAAERRGLDYLAIGDTHALREIVPGAVAPTYYPGAPEATGFDEKDTGSVLVVTFTRSAVRPRVHAERVGRWTWRDETVRSLAALAALAEEELETTVLRLRLELEIALSDKPELERLLERLQGSIAVRARVGAMVVDRSGLRLNIERSALPDDAPDVVRETEAWLKAQAHTDPIAKEALVLLHRLVRARHVKLGAIRINTFRGIRRCELALGPGLNVLFGPNDLGKSTVADALRAAFLMVPASAQGKELVPWGADARPEVTVEFECAAQTFRLSKTFGSSTRAAALLERATPSGAWTDEVRGRGVDGRLRDMLAWGLAAPGGKGRAGQGETFLTTALLAHQGSVDELLGLGLDADQEPTGRTLITAALGALGQDPRVTRLLERLDETVDRAFTKTGAARRTQDAPLAKQLAEVQQQEQTLAELQGELERMREVQGRVRALRVLRDASEPPRDEARRRCAQMQAHRAARRANEAASKAQAEAQADLERAMANEAALAASGEEWAALDAQASALEAALAQARRNVDTMQEEHARLSAQAARSNAELALAHARRDEDEARRATTIASEALAAAQTLAQRATAALEALASGGQQHRLELQTARATLAQLDAQARATKDSLGRLQALEAKRARRDALAREVSERIDENRGLQEALVQAGRGLEAERDRAREIESVRRYRALIGAQESLASLQQRRELWLQRRAQSRQLRDEATRLTEEVQLRRVIAPEELARLTDLARARSTLDAESPRTPPISVAPAAVVGAVAGAGAAALGWAHGGIGLSALLGLLAAAAAFALFAVVHRRRRVRRAREKWSARKDEVESRFASEAAPVLRAAGVSSVEALHAWSDETAALRTRARQAQQDNAAIDDELQQSGVSAERIEEASRACAVTLQALGADPQAVLAARSAVLGDDSALAAERRAIELRIEASERARREGVEASQRGESLAEGKRAQLAELNGDVEREEAGLGVDLDAARQAAVEEGERVSEAHVRVVAQISALEAHAAQDEQDARIQAEAHIARRDVLKTEHDRAVASLNDARDRSVEARTRLEAVWRPAGIDGGSPIAEVAPGSARSETEVDGGARQEEVQRLELSTALEAERARVRETETQLEACKQARDVAQGQLQALRRSTEGVDRAHLETALQAAQHALLEAPAASVDEAPAGDLDLAEAAAALEAAEHALSDVDGQLREAQGQLRLLGGAVLEEKCQAATRRLERLQAQHHALEEELHAHQLLSETLKRFDADRSAHLGKALARPVSERFAGLARGRYGAVRLDSALRTEGVDMAGAQRGTERLSIGTRDQLATLVRLSIAQQLRSTLLLDDQLVHSDEDRMRWFCEELRAAARDGLQIVVLTCRPHDYLDPHELPADAEATHDVGPHLRAVDMARVIERY